MIERASEQRRVGFQLYTSASSCKLDTKSSLRTLLDSMDGYLRDQLLPPRTGIDWLEEVVCVPSVSFVLARFGCVDLGGSLENGYIHTCT